MVEIRWEYAAAIILAVGGLVGTLLKSWHTERRERRAAEQAKLKTNLSEDAKLYERLTNTMSKQDSRIDVLESRCDSLNAKLIVCESHKAACDERVSSLEHLIEAMKSGDS